MHRYLPAWKSHSNHFFVAVLASSAIFTAGCANMGTTAAVSDSLPGTAAAVTGHVHGGSQAIAFATITVNFAGSTGIGSPGSVVATTTTADDGNGSFSFVKDPNNGDVNPPTGNTYACPSGSFDPLVYIKAVGGNSLNTHDNTIQNSASVFLAPLGRCSQISTTTFLDITEVTTAATIAALQQYIDPVAEVIGADSPGAATTALSNSFNLIPSLVGISTGTAVTSTTFAGGSINLHNGVTGTSVTATPAAQKLNTIANIIAACVNGNSASATPCQTLFTNATPPAYSVTARPQPGTAFPAATDVLQAAYYMFTNPTNGSTTNLNTLYNLPVGIGAPFQPALASAPNDWTVSIVYTSTSTCSAQSTSPVIPPSTGGLINSPVSLSIDINGNLWIANSQSGSGNLTQITPNGTPVVCVAMNATVATNSATAVTIDQPTSGSGNIWQGAAGSLTISRYNPATLVTTKFTVTEAPIALAADGIGNIYYSTALGNLYQIPNGANVTAAAAATLSPVLISNNPGATSTGLFVDSMTTTPQTGAIWMTLGNGSVTRTVPTTITTGLTYLNGFVTNTFTASATPPTYGITTTAVSGGKNNILTSIAGSSTASMIANLTGSGNSYATVTGWPTASGLGGLSTPTGIAIDGRANIWAANNTNSSSSLGSVSEISAAENALSPSTGFLKSSLINGNAIVVDQSGNVWVGGGGNNYVTEIVGAGVPVWQPYANGLSSISGFRFQTIP